MIRRQKRARGVGAQGQRVRGKGLEIIRTNNTQINLNKQKLGEP